MKMLLLQFVSFDAEKITIALDLKSHFCQKSKVTIVLSKTDDVLFHCFWVHWLYVLLQRMVTPAYMSLTFSVYQVG
jgi:hypothetical protein